MGSPKQFFHHSPTSTIIYKRKLILILFKGLAQKPPFSLGLAIIFCFTKDILFIPPDQKPPFSLGLAIIFCFIKDIFFIPPRPQESFLTLSIFSIRDMGSR
jgi:hypothetical protein